MAGLKLIRTTVAPRDTLRRVPLRGSDLFAVIDAADELLVAGFDWRPIQPNGDQYSTYAIAQHGRMYQYMHRLIVGAGPTETVDHVDGDGLNNRLSNLRIATTSQNAANRSGDRRRAGRSSLYKGVFWDRTRERWMVTIHVDGRTRYVGRFDSEVAAAQAYDRRALEAWGEFARLNFPEGVMC